MMDIPNTLLMDIGNVLLKVDIDGIGRKLIEVGGDPGKISLPDFYALAAQYEEGKVNTEYFITEGCHLTGLEGERGREAFRKAWAAVFENEAKIETTIEACRILKEKLGITLALFSNTNELHVEFMNSRYPEVIALFDHAVYSHVTGSMKPGEAMYREAVEQLGCTPEKTLYFDDKTENVETGYRLGFLAHVFDYRHPETFLNPLPGAWKRELS